MFNVVCLPLFLLDLKFFFHHCFSDSQLLEQVANRHLLLELSMCFGKQSFFWSTYPLLAPLRQAFELCDSDPITCTALLLEGFFRVHVD